MEREAERLDGGEIFSFMRYLSWQQTRINRRYAMLCTAKFTLRRKSKLKFAVLRKARY